MYFARAYLNTSLLIFACTVISRGHEVKFYCRFISCKALFVQYKQKVKTKVFMTVVTGGNNMKSKNIKAGIEVPYALELHSQNFTQLQL